MRGVDDGAGGGQVAAPARLPTAVSRPPFLPAAGRSGAGLAGGGVPSDCRAGPEGEGRAGLGRSVRTALGHRSARTFLGPGRADPARAVNGRRFRGNIMSAVASRGALRFTVFPGKSTAKVFCVFLERLATHAQRKVHVIVDRHPVHRSKTVKRRLAENTERIELHLKPGYSPKLNPDELLNADLKHHVHTARTTSIDDLARETRCFLHRRQRQPHIVTGYFHARHVRYTIQ
ncbi:transposase [Streptomyces olivoreticuli]